MKTLILLLLPVALLAQEPAKPAAEEQKKAADESTAAPAESALSGSIDVGARWLGWGGDFNTYRSLVNLGMGVRLLGVDLAWEPKSSRFVDSARLQGANWGGDPYNSGRLDLLKRGRYRYLGSYSNIAYFNMLPSFADPSLDKGVVLNQRSYDTTVRNFDNEVQLFPGARFVPYFGYSRNSSIGNGVTTIVETSNEYPVRNRIDWAQHEYRGGLRVEARQFHFTIEEGGRRYLDDQRVYSTEALTGNRSTSYLGQILQLTSGSQLYKVRGNGFYTKALLTATIKNVLDVSGSFVRTRPKSYNELNQLQSGTLAGTVGTLLLYTSGTDTVYGNAVMPRTAASGGAELKLRENLRFRQTWETDRATTSGLGLMQSLFVSSGTSVDLSTTLAERMETTRNRYRSEVLYDFSARLMVRGGYLKETGHAVVKASTYTSTDGTDRIKLDRDAFVAGYRATPIKRLTMTGDFEIGNGNNTYYRTGLMDAKRYRVQNRLTLPWNFFFNANYSRFDNNNPTTGVNYDYSAQTGSANVQWMPGGGKNITVIADYSRSQIKSSINYLYPLGLFSVASNYRDSANTGTLLADLRLPVTKSYAGRLTFGGSFVQTDGTRPTNYYQPQGRLDLPVTPKVNFFSEWRYWGLHESLYAVEGFRAHIFTSGLKITL